MLLLQPSCSYGWPGRESLHDWERSTDTSPDTVRLLQPNLNTRCTYCPSARGKDIRSTDLHSRVEDHLSGLQVARRKLTRFLLCRHFTPVSCVRVTNDPGKFSAYIVEYCLGQSRMNFKLQWFLSLKEKLLLNFRFDSGLIFCVQVKIRKFGLRKILLSFRWLKVVNTFVWLWFNPVES